MIDFPFKRIFGLVGAPRTGKDTVANFLTETRGFVQLAFADQIKEEFGITKEDFEAAKIAGNIEELRNELWKFSAKKKAEDPLYFIKKVIDKAEMSSAPVIITDIRTEDELLAFFGIKTAAKRGYWVRRIRQFKEEEDIAEFDEQGRLAGSKLSEQVLSNCLSPALPDIDMRTIHNSSNGLYALYKQLDNYFFIEDIKDIFANQVFEGNIALYVDQFEIRQKEGQI